MQNFESQLKAVFEAAKIPANQKDCFQTYWLSLGVEHNSQWNHNRIAFVFAWNAGMKTRKKSGTEKYPSFNVWYEKVRNNYPFAGYEPNKEISTKTERQVLEQFTQALANVFAGSRLTKTINEGCRDYEYATVEQYIAACTNAVMVFEIADMGIYKKAFIDARLEKDNGYTYKGFYEWLSTFFFVSDKISEISGMSCVASKEHKDLVWNEIIAQLNLVHLVFLALKEALTVPNSRIGILTDSCAKCNKILLYLLQFANISEIPNSAQIIVFGTSSAPENHPENKRRIAGMAFSWIGLDTVDTELALSASSRIRLSENKPIEAKNLSCKSIAEAVHELREIMATLNSQKQAAARKNALTWKDVSAVFDTDMGRKIEVANVGVFCATLVWINQFHEWVLKSFTVYTRTFDETGLVQGCSEGVEYSHGGTKESCEDVLWLLYHNQNREWIAKKSLLWQREKVEHSNLTLRDTAGIGDFLVSFQSKSEILDSDIVFSKTTSNVRNPFVEIYRIPKFSATLMQAREMAEQKLFELDSMVADGIEYYKHYCFVKPTVEKTEPQEPAKLVWNEKSMDGDKICHFSFSGDFIVKIYCSKKIGIEAIDIFHFFDISKPYFMLDRESRAMNLGQAKIAVEKWLNENSANIGNPSGADPEAKKVESRDVSMKTENATFLKLEWQRDNMAPNVSTYFAVYEKFSFEIYVDSFVNSIRISYELCGEKKFERIDPPNGGWDLEEAKLAAEKWLVGKLEETAKTAEQAPENTNPTAPTINDPIVPQHYGGANNEFETIKVLFAAGLGVHFCVGNAIKYISRMGKKEGVSWKTDCQKAIKYLELLQEYTAHGQYKGVPMPRKFRPNKLMKAWGLKGLRLSRAIANIIEGKIETAIYNLKYFFNKESSNG